MKDIRTHGHFALAEGYGGHIAAAAKGRITDIGAAGSDLSRFDLIAVVAPWRSAGIIHVAAAVDSQMSVSVKPPIERFAALAVGNVLSEDQICAGMAEGTVVIAWFAGGVDLCDSVIISRMDGSCGGIRYRLTPAASR